jgi:hypothetical protein
MKTKNYPIGILFFISTLFLLTAASARAAELKPNTLKAWNASVEAAEQRIAGELSSKDGFLLLDFQGKVRAAQERKEVLAGKIPIKKLANESNGKVIKVPDGTLQHWRGSVFIPGVTLDFVLSKVSNPSVDDTKQEDVLESRVLDDKTPGQRKIFLKLQRSTIVTVVFNTEHLVTYQSNGGNRASSSSIATKIAEVDRSKKEEREKPEGHDRGFLWKMNSYWRYQQVEGGVIVECESMTLSRSIPAFLELIAPPIINRIAHESIERTLQSLRSRLTKAYKLNVASAAL